METFLTDLRYGAKMLLKSKGLTIVAVFSLAVGIGANTVIFSIVNSIMLRPRPVGTKTSAQFFHLVWFGSRAALQHEGSS